MTRRELAAEVAARKNVYIKDIEEVFNLTEDVALEKMSRGEEIHLQGFVSMTPAVRKAKEGKLPNGEPYVVDEAVKIKVKVSPAFVAKVNELNAAE